MRPGVSSVSSARRAAFARGPSGSRRAAPTRTIPIPRPPSEHTRGRLTISGSTAPRLEGSTWCRSVPRGRCGSPRYASNPRRTISGSSSDWPRITKLARWSSLREDFARALVRDDLPLHALERVVDRLRVAFEHLGHLVVGGALEVHAQRVRLKRREARAEAEDQALELVGRDHRDRGI